MKEIDLAFEIFRSKLQDISSESILCIMQAIKILAAELAKPPSKELE